MRSKSNRQHKYPRGSANKDASDRYRASGSDFDTENFDLGGG
jgi:hypothetical protein